MFDWRSVKEWKLLWRYYQAGVVNTAFGYGLYALLVWLGINLFLAQIVSHVLGMVFNFFTYSRHTFSGRRAGRVRYVLSYAFNYLLSLALLALISRFVASPYLAGFIALLLVSFVNYLVLKRLVFRA